MRLVLTLLASLLIRTAFADEQAASAPIKEAAQRSLLQVLASPTNADVERIFSEFTNPDPQVRRRAIDAYITVSDFCRNPEREPTADELNRFHELLHDPEPRVRKAAMSAVTYRMATGSWFHSDVIPLLKDADRKVRLQVLWALQNVPQPIDEVLSDLESIVRGDDEELAKAALLLLVHWKQDDTVNRLLAKVPSKWRVEIAEEAGEGLVNRLLLDDVPEVQAAAIWRFRALNQSDQQPLRDLVLKTLTDRHYEVRDAAVNQLASLELHALEVDQVLVELSGTDANWGGRSTAWSSFSVNGRDDLHDYLMDLVADPTREVGVRADALAILTDQSNDSESLSKHWVNLLVQDSSQPFFLRVAGLRAFRHGKDSLTVPQDLLIEALAPTVPVAFREAAVEVLAARYPETARPLLARLYADVMSDMKQLEKDNSVPDDRRPVAWATMLLNAAVDGAATSEEKWRLIEIATTSGIVAVRVAAVEAIDNVASADQKFPLHRDIVHRLLNDSDESVREILLQRLANCDRRGKCRAVIVADDLVKLLDLKDEKAFYRQMAMEMLTRCRESVSDIFPRLMKEFTELDSQCAWRDDELSPRWDFLLKTLVNLFPDQPEVAAAVRCVFENEETRYDHLQLVCQLGPRLSMLRPQFVAMLEDASTPEDLARQAIEALGRLGSASEAEVGLLEKRLEEQPFQVASAVALLRISPMHARAGSIVAEQALRECNFFGCFRSDRECVTFLKEQREKGVFWLLEGLRNVEAERVNNLAHQVLVFSEDDDSLWLEPALREIAYDDRLEQDLRTKAQTWLKSQFATATN